MTRPDPNTTLSPADAQVLDVLLSAHGLLPPGLGERGDRMAALLSLLDHLPAGEVPAGLVDRVMAAVVSHAEPGTLPVICEEDQRVLDALLAARACGNVNGPMPAGSASRSAAVGGLLSLLDAWPVEAASSCLVDATLDRIDQSRRRLPAAGSDAPFVPTAAGSVWPMAIRRLGAVAAVGTLAVSVLLPMLSKAQRDAEIVTCRNNLAQTGEGLTSYASDNDDQLPRQQEPVFDRLRSFSEVPGDLSDGDSAVPSSSVYLFLLPNEGYLDKAHLACPSVEDGDLGGIYSTQNTLGRTIRLSATDGPLMADTNPLYAFGETILIRDDALSPWTASKNHGASGQNVMMADGSVRWLIRPAIQTAGDGLDNLWSRDAEAADAGEAEQRDVFLTP